MVSLSLPPYIGIYRYIYVKKILNFVIFMIVNNYALGFLIFSFSINK